MRQIARQEGGAQNRRKQHRHHPGEDQRNCDDVEQRPGIFPRGRTVQTDGDEPRHRHQRARQHREGDRGPGVTRRLFAAFAQLHPADHGFDGDHRVIDQKAQGDDQRAQRDALQRDPHLLHHHEGDRQHQRNRHRHHKARPPAQRNEADRQHDHHRLDQRTDEVVDRFVHHMRLVGDLVQLDPNRQAGLDLVHQPVKLFTKADDVAALAHPYDQAHRRLAVEADQRGRRIGIAGDHIGHVRQRKEHIAHPQRGIGQRLGRGELAGHPHQNLLGPGLDRARGRDGVFAGQRRQNRLAVKAKRGELAAGELQMHHLIAGADQVHLARIRQLQHGGAHVLHPVLHLARGKAVIGEGIDVAIDIAEIVGEREASEFLGEIATDVGHELAHARPCHRHIGGGRVVAQLDIHHRLTRPGDGAGVFQVVQILQLFLDAVGDLADGFIRRGAGQGGADDHGLDGKAGVFLAPQ